MLFYRHTREAMQAIHSVRSVRMVISAILTASVVACSSDLIVTTRFAPDFDPDQAETFALERTDLSLRPSWVDAQVKMELEEVLTAKGYKPEEYFGADLLISFQVQRRESHPLELPRRHKEPRSITFEEGSLTVEIRNSFNQQVFRGVARNVVAAAKEKTRARLSTAVKQLLDDFPARD
jgi:hypothetical protein